MIKSKVLGDYDAIKSVSRIRILYKKKHVHARIAHQRYDADDGVYDFARRGPDVAEPGITI